MPAVIGVGSPLVDLVLPVDEDFLAQHVSGAKGGMEPISAEDMATIIAASGKTAHQSPGGSAANIVVGCANLGVPSAFIGSCGDDDLGLYYAEALRAQACEPLLIGHSSLPTGRVLALITPDGERTMRTCLAAAAELDPAWFTPERFAGARLVVLEGYALFNPALARAVVRAAKAAGCELALDLAAFEVVAANRAIIGELLEAQVDIVFANQDEALAWLPGATPEAALADLARRVPVAVVKLGKDGALVARGRERAHEVGAAVTAVDSTGAGDCWAAGFIAGYLRRAPLAACARLGNAAGAAVVQVLGAQLPRAQWLGIKGRLDAWA